MTETMSAIVHPAYGTLALERVARPAAGPGQVLVRVHAACVRIADHHVITGKPYLIRLTPFGGVPRPKHRVPGMAIAGVVEAVGAGVTRTKPGDEIYGEASNGGFAEMVAVREELIAPKPRHLSFEEAAAATWAITPLQGLRDVAAVKAGQRVLINGASGGVGTWAVRIAKALGAEVTAVCSTRNVEMVRALGADHVIDYEREDFTRGGARFDVMFDAVGNRTLAERRSVIVPRGVYVACSGRGNDWVGPVFALLRMMIVGCFTSQKLKTLFGTPNRKDLLALTELIERTGARPVIEHRYPLSETMTALTHVGSGHARGQTVIQLAPV
jgi:NADPH:quinone reductase-like Zn-dependent oxidoreductase